MSFESFEERKKIERGEVRRKSIPKKKRGVFSEESSLSLTVLSVSGIFTKSH